MTETFERLLRQNLTKAYQNGLTDMVAKQNGVIETNKHAETAIESMVIDLRSAHDEALRIARLDELNRALAKKNRVKQPDTDKIYEAVSARYFDVRAVSLGGQNHLNAPETLKTCNQCNESKLQSDFYWSHGVPVNPCKLCLKDNRQRGLIGLKRIVK